MAIFMGINSTAAPALNSHSSGEKKNGKSISIVINIHPDSPESDLMPSAEKNNSPWEELTLKKFEELAKIHRFHKERVKNHKKHGHKFWILSKLLLIVCHLAILICAFLHVIH